jgi:hypothetical protein
MKDAFERRRVVPHRFLGRVSIDSFDPEGVSNFQNLTLAGYKIRIFLNGVEYLEVVMADPNAGLIRTVSAGRGLPTIVELKGDVSIRLERSEQS